MKSLLTSKAGVTVLEGVIALGLLALVAGGAFGVLLTASRQSSQPDVREEMVLAVSQVNNLLKAYSGGQLVTGSTPFIFIKDETMRRGICCKGTGPDDGCYDNPISPDTPSSGYIVDCKLPPICDKRKSMFRYFVESRNVTEPGSSSIHSVPSIRYEIRCNGYTL